MGKCEHFTTNTSCRLMLLGCILKPQEEGPAQQQRH